MKGIAHMSVPAVHCEAKLHAFRKTQEGVVISFVLHPQQVPERLALDPLGTRYMVALAAIGDDEMPLPPTQPVKPGLPKQQTARDRYQSQTEMQQATTRAGILCSDARFREWIGARSEDAAAQFIRSCCEVKSRSEIATDIDAYDKFIGLETQFKIATNQMAEPR